MDSSPTLLQYIHEKIDHFIHRLHFWGSRVVIDHPEPVAADQEKEIIKPNNFFWLSLLALGIAALSQFAFQNDLPWLASLGYGCAAVLFVIILAPFVPAIPTLDKATLDVRARIAPPHQEPILPDLPPIPLPVTDATVVSEPVPAPQTAARILDETDSIFEFLNSLESSITASEVSSIKPASVKIWPGFSQPESPLVLADGQVLILDASQHMVYRLDQEGGVVKQWSLPPLPELNGRNLAFSPDGRYIYITDGRQGLVYAVTLAD